MDEYKLTYGAPTPVVIDNLPLSNWIIVNTNTLSINGDTVTQLGVGGWYESMFVSFTVPETGSYKISYDYNITTAKVGNHGTYGFGLWLTTNNPNVSDTAQYNFYNDSSNRTGVVIGVQGETISGKHGTATFNADLVAGTTYYLWYPGAALDDGTTFTLSFSNIKVYNNPVQYTYSNILTFPGWNGYLMYENTPYYNLTLQTDGHGTLTATTLTGYPNDTSVLSYTANSNYAFSGYSIEGGGSIQNNTYTFGNEDGVVKAWFSAIPTSALYYSTDSVWAGRTETISINKPCTAFQYVAIQFNQSGYGGGGAEAQAYQIKGFNWNMRWHYLIGNYKPLRNGGSYTAINSNTGTRNIDGNAVRWYKGVAENANAKFKLVVDRNSNIASAFWNNTVVCKGSVNASTAITTIYKSSDQNYTPRNVGRIRCGGFKNLSDAAAWNP